MVSVGGIPENPLGTFQKGDFILSRPNQICNSVALVFCNSSHIGILAYSYIIAQSGIKQQKLKDRSSMIFDDYYSPIRLDRVGEFAFTGFAFTNNSAKARNHYVIIVFVFRAIMGDVNNFIRRDS